MKVCACPNPSSNIKATGTTGEMVLLITNARHSSAIATVACPAAISRRGPTLP